MKDAFAYYSTDRRMAPLRTNLQIQEHGGEVLIMPSHIHSPGREALTIKIASIFPHNKERGLPNIHGVVVVLEPVSGRVLALVEGAVLTAIRTGAASGVATDLLARKNSRYAAIIGAGVQARTQLEAICSVRSIETVWIYDLNEGRIDRMIEEMSGTTSIPHDLRKAASSSEAVQEADIICTATTSQAPVFQDADLKPGVHINAIGSFTPKMKEIPLETLDRAYIVVDSNEAILHEAGEIIEGVRSGVLPAAKIEVEIGEVVLGKRRERETEDEITVFKAVGIAVQDAMAARLAVENAIRDGLGQPVTW
jgi:ornithine cyclodeaminase